MKITITPHSYSAKTVFADALDMACRQSEVDIFPPGHISIESRERGGEYAKWRRYGLNGSPVAPLYLGEKTSKTAQEALEKLEHLKAIEETAKTLRRLGFASEENAAAATLGVLANAGFFSGGGILVGTRAFNCIINHLGFKIAKNLATQDVDIARGASVRIAATKRPLLDILKSTGLNYCEIPGLKKNEAPASWHVPGKNLKLDLLVPSKRKTYAIVPVPELRAHATGLLYLDYLIEQPMAAIIVGKSQLIPITVPEPARFFWHKLATASLRERGFGAKREKDIFQAACVAIMLSESHRDELVDAAHAIPAGMRKEVLKTFPDFVKALSKNGYEKLAEELRGVLMTGRTHEEGASLGR